MRIRDGAATLFYQVPTHGFTRNVPGFDELAAKSRIERTFDLTDAIWRSTHSDDRSIRPGDLLIVFYDVPLTDEVSARPANGEDENGATLHDTEPVLLPGRALCCLVALLPLLSAAACSDFKESRYTSMPEARRAGAVDRGWLPDILPDTSTNLREVHNIDTNETWCAFELSEAESARLRAKMSVLGHAEVAGKTIRSPGVAWWPRALQGTLDQRALDRAGIKLYASGRLLFAFEGSSGPSYVYSDSAR